jgi:hypothetical protein
MIIDILHFCTQEAGKGKEDEAEDSYHQTLPTRATRKGAAGKACASGDKGAGMSAAAAGNGEEGDQGGGKAAPSQAVATDAETGRDGRGARRGVVGGGGAEKKAKTADVEHPIDASGVLKSAKEGNFSKFSKLLKSQTHLSFEDFNSLPPGRNYGVVHQIAFHGNCAALEALLTAHPRVNLTMLTRDGKTAEDVAVEEGAGASFLDLLRQRVCRQVVNFVVINFLSMINFFSLDRQCGKGGSASLSLCFFGVCLRVYVLLSIWLYISVLG